MNLDSGVVYMCMKNAIVLCKIRRSRDRCAESISQHIIDACVFIIALYNRPMKKDTQAILHI